MESEVFTSIVRATVIENGEEIPAFEARIEANTAEARFHLLEAVAGLLLAAAQESVVSDQNGRVLYQDDGHSAPFVAPASRDEVA
jgi:hypothetical protein